MKSPSGTLNLPRSVPARSSSWPTPHGFLSASIRKSFVFVQAVPAAGEYPIVFRSRKLRKDADGKPCGVVQLLDRAGTDLGKFNVPEGDFTYVLKATGANVYRFEISQGNGSCMAVSTKTPGGAILFDSELNLFCGRNVEFSFRVPAAAKEVQIALQPEEPASAELLDASGKVVASMPYQTRVKTFKVRRAPTAADEIWTLKLPYVFGVRPGRPVLFRLPVTGARPLKLSVSGLPEGLAFDAKTGRLTGTVAKPGDHRLVFTAENAYGRAEHAFTLSVGERLALTPPMGWNSWNCFGPTVSEKAVREAAEKIVSTGLADCGWTYVNIDDFWQNYQRDDGKYPDILGPKRVEDGTIAVNGRFGSLKALTDHIHGLGLKTGIYSSPGPLTCGGCTGSWRHEERDARAFADWGFDYLKYDWCSYDQVVRGEGRVSAWAPYCLMGRALAAQSRDIVFSLCQYGMDNVSTWGAMSDGSYAVGLFNVSSAKRAVVFEMERLGFEGSWQVRDLWRCRDEGEHSRYYAVTLPAHASHVIRIRPGKDGRLRKGVGDVRDASWRLLFDRVGDDASDAPCRSCEGR